jgi:SAM-dependent methyltransferase
VPAVARVARDGGGVPYEAFRPAFTEVMDAMSRGLLDGQLMTGILPATGALPEQLGRGTRVADVGCGTGHSTNLLARAFPRSQFVGYDLSTEALERGRAEAAALGLDNVRFEVLDVATLPASPRWGRSSPSTASTTRSTRRGCWHGSSPPSNRAGPSS